MVRGEGLRGGEQAAAPALFKAEDTMQKLIASEGVPYVDD
jgi:hypothetical protein